MYSDRDFELHTPSSSEPSILLFAHLADQQQWAHPLCHLYGLFPCCCLLIASFVNIDFGCEIGLQGPINRSIYIYFD